MGPLKHMAPLARPVLRRGPGSNLAAALRKPTCRGEGPWVREPAGAVCKPPGLVPRSWNTQLPASYSGKPSFTRSACRHGLIPVAPSPTSIYRAPRMLRHETTPETTEMLNVFTGARTAQRDLEKDMKGRLYSIPEGLKCFPGGDAA